MERFTELLHSVAQQTAFDFGSTDMTDGVRSTSYAARPDEVLSSDQLREMFDRSNWDDPRLQRAMRARLIRPEELLSQLEGHIRLLLVDYINPDNDLVGHAFPIVKANGSVRVGAQGDGLLRAEWSSDVESFVNAMIIGAIILGPEKVASLFSDWAGGKPVRYRTSAMLNNGWVRHPVALKEGVRIETLSDSVDGLPAYLPKHSGLPASNCVGHTMVSIDTTVSPALFRPARSQSEFTPHVTAVAPVDIYAVCQAISLETDHCVDAGFYWHDYQELAFFSFSSGEVSFPIGTSGLRTRPFGSFSFSRSHNTGSVEFVLEDPPTLHLSTVQLTATLSVLSQQSNAVNAVVSRWMKSKDAYQNLADRFVDLRVALETLYLTGYGPDRRQEMRFRLALAGAWHLGNNFEERRRIFKTLRDAYDTASTAVHGGELDTTTKNRALLSDAQELCRQGILKMLKEGPLSELNDLVLGADSTNNSPEC